ncbi:hypothetical protein BJV77DRAFT_960287 [Russula vinacea]|nr:hypothetical protein BJV77DRAFT_960287 [Russula vinacea]
MTTASVQYNACPEGCILITDGQPPIYKDVTFPTAPHSNIREVGSYIRSRQAKGTLKNGGCRPDFRSSQHSEDSIEDEEQKNRVGALKWCELKGKKFHLAGESYAQEYAGMYLSSRFPQ